jgi:hypothetical protein
LNNGELIDSELDSLDYAGFFKNENIVQNSVKFKIRDYIKDYPGPNEKGMIDLIYDLKITFLSDSSLRWQIDRGKYGILPQLPNDMIFKRD